MKRIQFISPVESLRGNLSGNQKLVYAKNDNPAYDAPIGRNYARNYRPSFIGARVAKSGKNYFAVKTKSAAGISTRSKKAMALLGGTAAVIKAILADGARKAAIQTILEYQIQRGIISSDTSLRKFMDSVIRPALSNKAQTIEFRAGTGTTPVVVNNPWVSGGSGTDISTYVKNEILVKFWGVLANNPIVNKIEGAGTIIAHQDESFEDVINSDHNVLGLTSEKHGNIDFVKFGNMFVNYIQDGEEATQDDQSLVDANVRYVLSDTFIDPS